MTFRSVVSAAAACAGLAVVLLSNAGCGPEVALDKVVEVTVAQSGYTDMGLINGQSKLVPTATIRVKNTGTTTLSGFQLSAAFWRVGEDGQKDELLLPHLVAKDLKPGADSDPLTIRANFGYTLAGARADFFAHSLFVDFTIKVFAKANGRMVKIGEIPVERKILQKDGVVPIM